jgi:hypothetical protein
MSSHYQDTKPIAFAEMATAFVGLSWAMRNHRSEPTTVTLATHSSVVYYSLLRGTGLSLRTSSLLQKLYINMYSQKIKAGQGLVIRWVPSELNLADPLSRGFHALKQGQSLAYITRQREGSNQSAHGTQWMKTWVLGMTLGLSRRE